MTVPENNPVVQQRRLRGELRKAREQAKLTQAQVAEEMDWSVSKVIRIETGAVGLSITDLRALLQLYGVEDRAAIDVLVEMGKASRRRAWWDGFREFLNETMIKFIGLESSASIFRQYQDEVVPGLLQTSDYVRAIQDLYDTDAAVIEKRIEVRIKRQEILDPGNPAKFFFVVDERVFRRVVGGPEVMREQLERLREFNRQSNISIQVIPFSAGLHVGLKLGSFSVLEFPGDDQDHVAAVEQASAGLVLEDRPELVSEYVEAFLQLEDVAVSQDELEAWIERAIRDLG